MITTKNPLPGNLYLLRHTGGIRNVLLFIHDDGMASSVWASSDGDRIYRFKAFECPTNKGDETWLSDIRNPHTNFKAVFVKRADRPVYMMSNAEIEAIYNEFNVIHG